MTSARVVCDQLRRFVAAQENLAAVSQGGSLSDAGFSLLTLKDQLISDDARADFFVQEFLSRPHSGVELLLKVIYALQSIVNSTASSSKISNLLSRNNSSGNRKRKAAVAEADSIECLKLLLEKSQTAWRAFLDSPGSLEVILCSVNSPQLDSKCYALEIILLLLDQPQGFGILWRSLTVMAARSRDYIRLSIFVSQLKYGLHTSKLHIQILVVRLLNKLLGEAPSSNLRLLAQVEAGFAHFSPDHLEKLVLEINTPLGGLHTLLEELSIYRSLCGSGCLRPGSEGGGSGRNAYSYSSSHPDAESDSAKARRVHRTTGKIVVPTTVVKNVERQRVRKAEGSASQGGSGGRAGVAPSGYYPHRSSYTISNTFDPHSDEAAYPSRNLDFDHGGGGGMRRAKSESAMLFDDSESMARILKRAGPPAEHVVPTHSDYHPLHTSKILSRSIHDLSSRASEDRTSSLLRNPLNRPPSLSSHQTRSLQRTLSPPRARFADPPIMDTPQQPHAGFSYLFPTAPTLATVVPKRPITPDVIRAKHSSQVLSHMPPAGNAGVPYSQSSLGRPPSAPLFEQRGPLSPTGSNSTQQTRSDGQVTYIPVNLEGTRRKYRNYNDRVRPTSDEESVVSRRESAELRLKSPSGTIGEDVRDALSQFDYLNEYDAASSSPRARPPSNAVSFRPKEHDFY